MFLVSAEEKKRSLFGGKSTSASPKDAAAAAESASELLALTQANIRELLLVLLQPAPDAASTRDIDVVSNTPIVRPDRLCRQR